MNKRFAKIISLMLVLVMVLGVVPGSVFAGPQYNDGTNGFGDLIRNWWEIIVRPLPWYKPTPNYPAQSFGGDDLGGLVVNVEAPAGALPEGTEMYVERVYNTTNIQTAVDNSDLINGDVIAAVDITFYHNGAEFQPGSDVKVTLSYAGFDGCDDLSVVHIGASAEEVVNEVPFVDPVEDVESDGETVSFDARDFSIYAVVADDTVADVARLKVQFFGEDTVNPIAVVYINKLQNSPEMIEKIIDIEPEVVTNSLTVNDLVFCGWIPNKRNYTVSDFINGDHDIDQVRAAVGRRLQRDVAEGDVMNVYAMLFYEFSVKYVGEEKDGKNPVLETVTLYSKDGSPVGYQIDLSYTPNSLSTSKFNGWLIEGDSSNTKYQYGDTLTVTGDTVLMTDVSNGHWIAFNEKPTDEYKDAKYVAPKFFETNETMDGYTPADSSLAGYHFDGWYTDTTYTTRFNFTGKLTENKTLYAKWTMNSTADYTVIVWQQDVEDSKAQNLTWEQKKYNYVFSVNANTNSKTAITEGMLNSYTGFSNNPEATVGTNTYDFRGFVYKHEYSVNNAYEEGGVKKIHPAGTTIINVYYDRVLIELDYYVPNGGYDTVTPNWSGNYMNKYYANVCGGYYKVNTHNNSYNYVGEIPFGVSKTYRSSYTFCTVIDGYFKVLSWHSSYNTWYTTVDGTTYWYDDGDFTKIYCRVDSNVTVYQPSYSIDNLRTMTGLYGSTLEDNGYSWKTDYDWYSERNHSGVRTTFLDAFLPTSDANPTIFYGATPEGTVYFRFYKQNKTGTGYGNATNTILGGTGAFYLSDKYNGFTLSEYSTTSATSGFETVGGTYTNSTGDVYYYTHDGAESLSHDGNVYVHFSRNKYNIEFMWGAFLDGNGNYLTPLKSGIIKTVDEIYYETNIDSYKVGGSNYFDPTRTLGNPGYVFEGWYIDPECTVPYDFTGKEMPANDIAVFARFRTIQYRVFLRNCGETGAESYNVEFNDENQSQNFCINYGEYISGGSPIEATRSDGMILAGWYLDAALTEPFDFEQEITDANTVDYDKEDPFNYTDPASGTTSPLAINKDVDRTWITRKLDLYAKWVRPLANVDGINVVYDANDNGTVTGTRQKDGTHTGSRYYTDPALYSDGVAAIVRTASTPDNSAYTFDYWELLDKNGNVIGTYKPGEKFVIDAATMARLENPAAGSKGADSTGAKSVAPAKDVNDTKGAAPSGQTKADPKYEKVTSLEAGKQYLIVQEYNGTAWVMTDTYQDTNSCPGMTNATISNNQITGNFDSYLFTVSGNSSGYSFANSKGYLGISSSYLVFGSTYTTWIWDGTNLVNAYSSLSYKYVGTSGHSTSSYYDVYKNTGTYLTISFYKPVDESGSSSDLWVPTTTITANEEYLIGVEDNGNVYLIVNYSPLGNHYYVQDGPNYDSEYDNYETWQEGYAALAVVDSNGNVTGINDTTAASLNYCTWKFSSTSGGTITSGTDSSRYLYSGLTDGTYYSKDNLYRSLYPSTSERTWIWNASRSLLYAAFYYGSITCYTYPAYYSESGTNVVYQALTTSSSDVPSNGNIKLYKKQTAHTLTINYVMADGSTAPEAYTALVAEGGSYSVTSPNVTGYTPDRAVVSGNMGTSDKTETVTYTKDSVPTHTVTFKDGSGNVINTQTVDEGTSPTAPADPTAPTGKRFDGWTIEGGDGTVYASANLPAITGDTTFVAHFSDAPIAGWYFETPADFAAWTFNDADGDGYNWYHLIYTTASNPDRPYYNSDSGAWAYEGAGHITSASYIKVNDNGVILTPDNWAFSPTVTLPTGSASVTLYAKGQDPSYAAEHIAIYCGTSADPASMVMVSSEIVTTGTYVQYSADLNDFTGQTVYIGIRHYNVSDKFRVNVDQVEVWGENATVVPQGPYTVTFIDNLTGTTLSTQTVPHGDDAVAPEVPSHEGYTFIGWSTSFVGVTSNLIVYAMYRSNSANVDLNTMTVLMRAHYSTKQYTFITWHANNGTGNKMDSEKVMPNAKINIELPKDEGGNDMFTWENHVFLGWARLDESDSEGHPITIGNQVALNEDDLFLKWDGSTKKFYAQVPENSSAWKEVTHVAADELVPYHGMYAVWADVFYVYHSGTGKVEQIVRTSKAGTTFNLANRTSDGYLYGGYYKDYAGKSSNFNEKTMGWTAIRGIDDFTNSMNVQTKDDTGAKKYNGGNVVWNGNESATSDKTEIWRGNGLNLVPEAGDVFFIKEVPAAKYLRPYLHYTFYKTSEEENAVMPISTAWLISDVDDNNYSQTGFVIISANNMASLVKSLTVTTNTDPDNTITLTAMKIFGVRGYLSYLTVIKDRYDGTDPISLLADGDRVAQYWVTPDGLIVTGTAERTYSSLANTSISANTQKVESVISVFNATNPSPVVKPGK